jgi:elongation factor Tu
VADIEAEIWFLSHNAGGRRGPVASGYRPQFFYENEDWDATHEYPGVDWVQPGERVLARLAFITPDQHWGRIYVGMPFLLREGSKTVGYGIVKGILDLEAHAISAKQSKK